MWVIYAIHKKLGVALIAKYGTKHSILTLAKWVGGGLAVDGCGVVEVFGDDLVAAQWVPQMLALVSASTNRRVRAWLRLAARVLLRSVALWVGGFQIWSQILRNSDSANVSLIIRRPGSRTRRRISRSGRQYFLASAFRQVDSAGILFKLNSLGNAVTGNIVSDPGLHLIDLAQQMETSPRTNHWPHDPDKV